MGMKVLTEIDFTYLRAGVFCEILGLNIVQSVNRNKNKSQHNDVIAVLFTAATRGHKVELVKHRCRLDIRKVPILTKDNK